MDLPSTGRARREAERGQARAHVEIELARRGLKPAVPIPDLDRIHGSGAAFVLTPGMMTLGVPGAVVVASNMCHKFPKTLVGAFMRYKYGQVGIKLGLIVAAFAAVGVHVGIKLQQRILARGAPGGL